MFWKDLRTHKQSATMLLRHAGILSEKQLLRQCFGKRFNHMDSSCVELPMDKDAPLLIPSNSVVFSMIQPTGIIHLGNYLGAISTWKLINDKKQPGQKVIYGIADLHALTILKKDHVKELEQNRMDAIAALLSCGIDPNVSTINFQSMVGGYHTELFWYLSCLTPMGYLNRMTQWKDKKSGDQTKERLGLFAYPVLQAADILIYKGTHVPVGDDQSQHLELTRYLAERFNAFYNVDFFPSPKTLYNGGHSKKINSLSNPEKKMSKSSENKMSLIYVTDEPDVIRQKIRKSKTDSISDSFYYDIKERPGISNLIDIVSGLQQKPIEAVEKDISQFHNHTDFKNYVSDVIIDSLAPVRENYKRYTTDKTYLQQVIQQGYQTSRSIAQDNIAQLKEIIGLGNHY